MSFNSAGFFVFLVLVIVLYRALPYKIGKYILIVASYYFYGATVPWYCILLFLSTITDFFAGKWIYKAESNQRKKQFLGLSLLVNFGLLFLFKYYDFVAENLNILFINFGSSQLPLMDVVLPIGISFYTFQTLSYTIDIYRGIKKPCENFATFSLYVAYFPQLVAGPVERSHNLIPQIEKKHKVPFSQIMHGIERILWGLVKKMVFADRLAVIVNQVFAAPEESSSLLVLVAIIGFGVQLYLDFSGYCDIAIGTARLMGVRLTENFNWPMNATNMNAFWNRWNITLTHWFRDYFFNSLGGFRRKNLLKSLINVMLFFIAVGLWHGANWNFVVFGFYNGIMVAIYMYWRIYEVPGILKNKVVVWITGYILIKLVVLFGMFLFRVPDLSTANQLLHKLSLGDWSYYAGQKPFILLAVFSYSLILVRGHFREHIRKNYAWMEKTRIITNYALLMFLIFAAYDFRETFIYFQF